jgi:hypothetical protein
MRIYRNMQSRVLGIVKPKAHLYAGLDILSRDKFYEWAKNSPEFDALFDAWTDAGYPAKLAPSVDRVDPSRGYQLDNMEWVTHSENSRRASKTRKVNPAKD